MQKNDHHYQCLVLIQNIAGSPNHTYLLVAVEPFDPSLKRGTNYQGRRRIVTTACMMCNTISREHASASSSFMYTLPSTLSLKQGMLLAIIMCMYGKNGWLGWSHSLKYYSQYCTNSQTTTALTSCLFIWYCWQEQDPPPDMQQKSS
jgi:hypothetical protein